MYDINLDLNPSPDWIECSRARAWARTDLPFETVPSFGSSARRGFQQSIVDDETEIMRLEDSIRGIMLKLQELQHRVGQNRTRLAPIRLIPNEILSDIFLEWLYSREPPKYSMEGGFVPPSRIMKVCRRWNACAISTPPIWSHGKHWIRETETLDRVSTAKTYFDRSGSRNLKVDFGGSDDPYQTDKIWREVMEPALHRLEDLTFTETHGNDDDLSASDDWPDRKFVTSLAVCTRLTRLSIVFIDFPESENQVPIVLPTVRTIEYVRCNGNPPIICPGLVACEMEECSFAYSFVLTLSKSSPSLERVRLNLAEMDDAAPGISPAAFLNLKHLEIEEHSDMSGPKCFFEGSDICRLDLHLSNADFGVLINSLPLSSSTALTSLTLHMSSDMVALGGAGMRAIQDWMVQAHNLVEFQLDFDWIDDSIEKYGMNMYFNPLLTTTKRNPPCFPHLKHMTVKGELGLEAAFLQFLLDRATAAERVEAGFEACGDIPGIVQRPCLLTILDSEDFPDVKSVGLKEYMRICETKPVRVKEDSDAEVT